MPHGRSDLTSADDASYGPIDGLDDTLLRMARWLVAPFFQPSSGVDAPDVLTMLAAAGISDGLLDRDGDYTQLAVRNGQLLLDLLDGHPVTVQHDGRPSGDPEILSQPLLFANSCAQGAFVDAEAREPADIGVYGCGDPIDDGEAISIALLCPGHSNPPGGPADVQLQIPLKPDALAAVAIAAGLQARGVDLSPA